MPITQTKHQLAINKIYKEMYPVEIETTSYLDEYWGKYNHKDKEGIIYVPNKINAK